METKYTLLNPEDGHLAIATIRADLTPALPRLNIAISAEVDAALKKFMPACDDWTEVNINYLLTRMVAMVSGRVFVGQEICETDDYIDTGANYTVDMMKAVFAVKKIRPWLKPFLANRTPEIAALRKREDDAKEMLTPIVKNRMEAQAKNADWTPPDDMLQWMLNRMEKKKIDDNLKNIAKQQLGLIFAAVHTTTMTATNVLYSLAVTPQYIPELREEISQAIKEEGDFTSKALQSMEKLDSYMKEVMRFYPVGITSFSRGVLKNFTLSNGQHIPAGSIIEVPAAAINFNPEHFPNPTEFDPFRFQKKRHPSTSNGHANGSAKADSMGSSNHAGHQFVTTNESNLLFGYGRHACPGRFFAANEIKMFLSNILLNYDIKMKDDSLERHKNLEVGTSSMPNPMATLMFRKVRV